MSDDKIIDVPGRGPVAFPASMSNEEIAAAIKKNLLAPKKESNDHTKELIRKVKEEGWGTGFPKFAHELGGRVTDVTGSPAAGAVTNAAVQAVPMLLSGFRAGPATLPSGQQIGQSGALLEGPSKWLLQKSVKPKMEHLKSGDADKALKTMLEENIYPTRGGMEKASKIVGQLDGTVEKAIEASTAKVPIAGVTARLQEPLEKATMQANPKADMAAVENAWTEFLTSPHIAGKSEIPVQLAHKLKKGTQDALGSKAYGEIGTASTEAQKAIARGLREDVASAVPAVQEPLKREAALLNAMEVAGPRALISGNNNPMGLGALRFDHLPSQLGFMADRWDWLKAFLAQQAYHGSKPQVLGPAGMAGGLLANEPAARGLLGQIYAP